MNSMSEKKLTNTKRKGNLLGNSKLERIKT